MSQVEVNKIRLFSQKLAIISITMQANKISK